MKKILNIDDNCAARRIATDGPRKDRHKVLNAVDAPSGPPLAQDRQAQSQAWYCMLIENMQEGVARCQMIFESGCPVDFVYLEVNTAFEVLTGLKNVAGRKASELTPGLREHNPELLHTYGRVSLTGKPERSEIYLEALQTWFSIAVYSQAKESFVTVFDNIPLHKRTEEARRQKMALLEAVITSSPNGILVVNQQNQRVVQNAQFNRLLKIPAPMAGGSEDPEQLRYVADSTKNPEEFYQRVLHLNAHPAESSQDEIEFKDGRVLDRNTAGVFGENGQYFGRLWSFLDITERKRMAEEVRRSETKFRILFETARDAKFILDPQGNVLDVNQEACRQLQYTREELQRMNVREIDTPENATLAPERIRQLLRQGHILFETASRRRDGSIVSLEVNSQLMEHEGQTIILATCRDLTERKQAEEKLLWQNSALKAAANAIVITDRKGNIVFVNQAFTTLTGYTEQEVLGKNPRMFKSGVHPDDFYRQLWVTITAGFAWKGEMTNRRKDGTIYHEEMTITPVSATNKGRTTHFIAIKQDISERKRAEELLRETAKQETGHQKTKIIKELAILSLLGTAYVSLMGYTDWLQRPAEKFAVEFRESLDNVFNILCVLVAGFFIFAYRRWKEIRNHVSRQMAVEKALRTLHAELEMRVKQRTTELTTVNHSLQNEIADRKQSERDRQNLEIQLRQAHKLEAIGQLAAGIAHEINTPTQYVGDNTRFLRDAFAGIAKVVQSHSELLTAAKKNSLTPEMLDRAQQVLAASDLEYLQEQVPSAIAETLEGVERVSKIVRAMKDFSHPGGKEKAIVDLNKAIESTLTVARNEWKYVADLKLDLAQDLPGIRCFLGEFNQSILNLIVNAAHAIGDVVKKTPGTKGLITVRTRLDEKWVEVRVSDTGTGIAEAHRPHIFEPFFTTKDVGRGTGQGLALVYNNIVKLHGGTVVFETETGKGTTFIIRLPLIPPPTPVKETVPQHTPVS